MKLISHASGQIASILSHHKVDSLEHAIIQGGDQMGTFMNDIVGNNGGEDADVLPNSSAHSFLLKYSPAASFPPREYHPLP